MKSMREKNYSKPVASVLVGCKRRDYVTKAGHKGMKGKGSFQLPNGDTLVLEVSRASESAEKEKGIAFWVNAALFQNSGSRR